MKQPAAQAAELQTSPVPHADPFERSVHAEVLVPGWQVWQALVEFTAPVAKMVPPMSHCVPHCPALHTCPLPHAVPLAMLLHAVVLVPGWQLSHGSLGSSAADA
jgi:hypothetical protein